MKPFFSKREQQQTHALEKKIQNLQVEHEQALAQLQQREKELSEELNTLKEEKRCGFRRSQLTSAGQSAAYSHPFLNEREPTYASLNSCLQFNVCKLSK